MRYLLIILFATNLCLRLKGDEAISANPIKASLIFRQSSGSDYGYPHLLRVYLHLENKGDTNLTIGFNYIEDISTELFDPSGKPATKPDHSTEIASNPDAYMIPRHGKLELEISHGGIGMMFTKNEYDPRNASYALMVGGQGWLIPTNEIQSYKLNVCVRGWPSVRDRFEIPSGKRPNVVLFNFPKTPIIITTNFPDAQ